MIKINIRHAFNRIRMTTLVDEDLITFKTRFESYKYLVLLFDLINESATFQNFMNDIFIKYLNEFVIIYLNDILIYSKNKKEHKKHVRKVLQKLRNVEIQADINKCEFNVFEKKFLEVIVEVNEIRMNSKKIQTII
jgi:hypothetical protein